MMEQQRVEKTRKRMNIEFPSDILVEVLSRLPYKSLCRFTCVSKEWHSLISSPAPGLVKDLCHQLLHRNRPYLYIWDCTRFFDNEDIGTLKASIVDTANERVKENYSLPITEYCEYFEYIVSCRNIICIIGEILCIHNPSTKETRMLPDSGELGDVGFGYSSLANEYKVVQWFREKKNDDNFTMGCKIFSISDRLEFKSDSWRLIETRPFECLDRRHPVCVNGVIYWLIQLINHPSRSSYHMDSILAMDLDKEESKIISCPKHSPFTQAYLLELKDFLYLAHCWLLKGIVKMWRLEDPKNSVWVSEYCINFPSLCKTFVPLTSVLVDRVEKLVFMSLGDRNLLYFFYNVQTGTMRKLDNLGHIKQYYRLEHPCILKYME